VRGGCGERGEKADDGVRRRMEGRGNEEGGVRAGGGQEGKE